MSRIDFPFRRRYETWEGEVARFRRARIREQLAESERVVSQFFRAYEQSGRPERIRRLLEDKPDGQE